jgi:hypothetical protein
MISLTECLNEWGVEIDEGAFLALLRETFDEIAGKDLWSEPEQELPPEEIELLRSGGFSTKREALGSEDPVFRGALDFSALIVSAVSTKEAASLLEVDPSRIRQRLIGPRPTLYGVKWRGEWLLPRFQFAGKEEIPGFAEVVPHLDPHLNPVAVARWFLSPSPDLVVEKDDEEPMSPRDWLLAGHSPMEVARLAEGL